MSQFNFYRQRPGSLWRQNPVTAQLLGLSPMLAVSRDITAALALALCTLLVLCCAAVVVSLLRGKIGGYRRFPCYLGITAALTAVVVMILERLAPELTTALGVYLPLIGSNLLVIVELERSALYYPPLGSLRRAAVSGAAFALLIVTFTLLRQIVAVAVLASTQALDPESGARLGELVFSPGFAFILLGLMMAGKQFLDDRLPTTKRPGVQQAQRARVSERVHRLTT